MSPDRLLTLATILAAVLSAALLVWQLSTQPAIDRRTIVLLLFGLGVFPIAAAAGGNVKGFEVSKTVEFCDSCHVMKPFVDDARNAASTSLASMHTRNERFGSESCYVCHANYSMYGTVLTKLEGSRHVWMYYTKFRSIPNGQALPQIALYKPFPNSTCMQCHSTTLQGWNDEPEHQAVLEDVRNGTTSCASEGCHSPAHDVAGVKNAEGGS